MYTAAIVMFEGSSRITSDIVKGNLRVKLYPSLLVGGLFSYLWHFTLTIIMCFALRSKEPDNNEW